MHPFDIGHLEQQLIGTLVWEMLVRNGTLVWEMLVRNGTVSGKVCFMRLFSLNTNKASYMCQCG